MQGREYNPNWVQLKEYTPSWSDEFEREKMVLLRSLGDIVLDVQHVGSTSISGLSAKPIVDILVGVEALSKFSIDYIRKLEEVGYTYRGDAGVSGRIFLRKGKPRAKFHLSIAALNGDYWNRQIIFRDYLRAHPQDTNEYEKLKMKLAKQYPNDRATYTSLKDPLIASILEKAHLWWKNLSSEF